MLQKSLGPIIWAFGGTTAITKLITHEKSGNTVTLAEKSDRMLEQEGLTKHISLHKER